MLVVGLTGGIASGKSTVSNLLSTTHNLPLIDADLLARQVIQPGTSGYKAIISHWGADRILLSDGVSLDRAAIGDIVFHDENERRWLNGIVHPAVRKEMVKGVVRCWLRGEWCCVVDVPLLIEGGLARWVGEVVVVYVNERLQLTRLLSRPSNPPLSQTQAQARISSQLALSQKLSHATSVIDNSGTLPDLNAQVDRLVQKWKKQQGGKSGWWWRVCWLIPPVGLVAGGLCLVLRGLKGKGRRRGRGEVRGRGIMDGDEGRPGERIELMDLGRRRGGSGFFEDD